MDPLALAKQKMANGEPLNRQEVQLISNSGVTSSEIQAVKNPPPTQVPTKPAPVPKKPPLVQPQGNVIPTPQNPENVANAQKVAKTAGDQVETYEQWIARTGKPMSPGAAKEYAANLRAMVPQPTPGPAPAPVAIPATPITPVTSAKTATVPAKAPVVAAPPVVAQEPVKAPVSMDTAKSSVNAMDAFLKSNPDGVTLANILDAAGVGLSARGGVQRQTALQQRKAKEMEYAAALGQQQTLKAMDLDNQAKLLDIQLKNALAQNNQQAALDIQNRLKEIEAQKQANIEQSKAVAGVTGLTNAGGLSGLVNKYAGVGQ